MKVLCPECGSEAEVFGLRVREEHVEGTCALCAAELTITSGIGAPAVAYAAPHSPPPEMPGAADENPLIAQIEALVRKDRLDLPVLPEIALKLNEILRDPEAPLSAAARLVEKEPVIAARVLRLANSSFYRGLKEIKSPAEAVSRLGTRTVQAVVMAVVTKRLINDFQGKIGSRILERLWEHALSSAVAAREVARASRFGEVELAFTGGLLHNIGEVVLLRGIAEVASSAGTEFPETLTIEVLDRFHAPIGGKVLRAWRLPEPIPTIAEYHHEPEKAPENFADSVAIVHLADLICAKLRLGLAPTGDEDFWKIAAESAQRLGIGEVALAATEVTIEDLRGEIQTIL